MVSLFYPQIDMNRLLLLLMFSLAGFAQTDKKQQSTELLTEPFEVLKGSVKQVIEAGVSLRGSPLLIFHHDTIVFDKKGHQVELRARPGGRFSYTYQSIDTDKEIVLIHPSGNWKRIYRRASNGLIVETVDYLKNEIYEQHTYTYDSLGRVTERKTFIKKNATSYSTRYCYNRSGYLTEESNLSIGKKVNLIIEKTEYQYISFDKKGNWTTQTKTNHHLNDNLTNSPDTR
jgi:YD repeat-containing protein